MPLNLVYQLTHDVDVFNVAPLEGNNIKIGWKREEGEAPVYRKSISDLTFLKRSGFSGYDEIKAIIDGGGICDDVLLSIDCSNSALFDGKIKLIEGDYNDSDCRAVLKAKTNDEYLCFDENRKIEYNLLEAGQITRQTVNFLFGEIEEQRLPAVGTFYDDDMNPANPVPGLPPALIPSGDGWTIKEVGIENISANGLGNFQGYVYTVWVREFINSATMPPGNGWTLDSGTLWVRTPPTIFDSINSDSFIFGDTTVLLLWEVVGQVFNPIDNGLLLEDCINFLLDKIGCGHLTVKSDFFSINPDGSAPSNDAYTEAIQKLSAIMLWQKSDVKRPDVSNNATIFEMSIDGLMNILRVMFQVYWKVEGNVFRLEHATYFLNPSTGLDLTQTQYEAAVKRASSYKFNTDNLPREERFLWHDSTAVSSIFAGSPIRYAANCSTSDPIEAENAINATTDLQTILDFPESFADSGAFIANTISFAGDYYFDSEAVTPFTTLRLNGHLSFPNLHENYYQLAPRYQPTGELNGATVSFTNVRPYKVGSEITIQGICCEDFLAIDPADLITTPLGWGRVETMEYNPRNGTLRLNLIY